MKSVLLAFVVGTMLSLPGCSKESADSTASALAAGAKALVPSLSNAEMQAKVCKRLKQIVPKLGGVPNAQALLLVEIADEFDNNPDVLHQVAAGIDELASSGCAAERQSILAVMHIASLQEAVRF
jgi:hypothetical protein